MKFFNDIFTGADNITYDMGRVYGALTGVFALFMQGWSTIHDGRLFDMQAFGIGIGALSAGIGSLLKLKENTEPKS